VSIDIPAPRLPAVPPLPDADLLDELLPGAGDPVRAARAEAVASVDALVACRPGGSDWLAARRADQQLVLGGKKPTKVAALLAGDAGRYGTALALSSTLPQRATVQPAAGLADAARAACVPLVEALTKVTVALSRAQAEGRLADAHKAREQGVIVASALAERQAVARWAAGAEFRLRAAELPEVVAEGWLDAVEALDGVPAEQSWRAVRGQQTMLAEFNAKVGKAGSVY
jgi:hypothetical protein